MRAAALASILDTDWEPMDVHKAATKLYSVRSKIVHEGKTSSPPRAISATPTVQEPSMDRQLAIELLRFVLDALLRNPEYLDPLKIDETLLTLGYEDDEENGAG